MSIAVDLPVLFYTIACTALLFFVATVLFMLIHMARAPKGRQDKRGFHEDEP